MKILIRAPNWIGDAVLALPALKSVHLNFPDSQIWVAARNWVKDLFQNLDYIEGIIPLPDSINLKNIPHLAKTIKQYKFDISLLFTNSFSSALLFFAARIPDRWGYPKDGRQILLTRTPSPNKRKNRSHHVYYYLNLLEGLGLKITAPDLSFPVPDSSVQRAVNLLQVHGIDKDYPLIVFNPGASYGTAKQWPVSSFAQLGSMLQKHINAEILIVGARSERDIGKSIASLMQKKPYVLTGQTTLMELAGILKMTTLIVSNDSGPMHLANAIHTPVIALFGPTNPQTTGPLQQPCLVIKKEVSCWPCKHRECPLDHLCMMEIKPDEVFHHCQEFLK